MSSFPAKNITRREALRLASAPLIASSLTRFASAAETANGFTFIAVNDLHSFSEACAPFFQTVVTKMRESAPNAAFCLISGDLADGGEPAQYAIVRAAFDGLRVPLHPVPGNHDFIKDGDRTGYDTAFPDKLNYTFNHGGWQFIGLDSTQGIDFEETNISPATLAWLDSTIPALDPATPTVAFTHFPLGKGTTYRPLNADALLEKLGKLNLRATFSGHWHGLNEQRLDHADLIVNRCCARIRGNRDGSPLKGWWVCHAAPDGTLTHKFATLPIEKVDAP